MIDLSPCDSAPGQPPLRATKLPGDERVLHIHLWTKEDPQNGLCAALERLSATGVGGSGYSFCHYHRIDWTRYTHEERPDTFSSLGSYGTDGSEFELDVLAAVQRKRPTIIWMQLQTANVASPRMLRQIRNLVPDAVLISWCGDVGRDPAWSHEIAPYFDLMLFSSMTQVEEHRAAGFPNAAYLQIGYDPGLYYEPKDDATRGEDVVFLGQNYSDAGWVIPHEAQLRRDVVELLHRELGKQFTLYGQGWKGLAGLLNTATDDADHELWLYRANKCAVSVSLTSKLKRYSSDRLLRALACGPVILVKRFEEMSSWGLKHGENCWVWDTPIECLEGARWCFFNQESARQIGAAGAKLAREHHTWDVRMLEMQPYIEYVRGKR